MSGIDPASEFLDDFAADPKTQAAVLYQITIVGEATKRLSPEFRGQHPNIIRQVLACASIDSIEPKLQLKNEKSESSRCEK
jgi:hypothetical protein